MPKKATKKPKLDDLAIDCHFLDKRVKLLPCQRELIPYWRYERRRSIKALSRMFHVSRRLIESVLMPQKKKEKISKLARERGGHRVYYDKDKHRERVSKFREHKRKIKPLLQCKRTPKDTGHGQSS